MENLSHQKHGVAPEFETAFNLAQPQFQSRKRESSFIFRANSRLVRERHQKPLAVVFLIFTLYMVIWTWPEIFEPEKEAPDAWDFSRATVRDAIVRDWGPNAELRREADGKCLKFVKPADEPPYGAVQAQRYKTFSRRLDKNLTMSQFLMVPPLSPPPLRREATGPVPRLQPPAPRSALITLTLNSKVGSLLGMLDSLIRFVPSAQQYPYFFFNDMPFREDVKEAVGGVLCKFKSVHFEQIPKEHWIIPSFVNRTYLDEKLEMYRTTARFKRVPYMSSLSYRLMCRWNSGAFALHPALKDIDYFWRIDDDLRFLCPVENDPLITMETKKLVYGFGMTMRENPATVPTLMDTVLQFSDAKMQGGRGWLNPAFLRNDRMFTRCHFWNNFALGNLNFFRSPEYQAFFNHLDRSGGFFYERWGDAPVHTLGVALLSNANQSYHFHDISYGHDQVYHLATPTCAPGIRNNFYRSDRFGDSVFSCTWKILSETKQDLQRKRVGFFDS